MSTQQIAKRETLEAILARPAYAERFKQVLGSRAPQFLSSLLSVGRSMPDVDPKSIVASAMIAATLDLPIEKNLGFAWIVPYKDGETKYAQFQMGYKGYVQLALRTGRYERMNAKAINQEAIGGFDEVGEPKIDWTKVDETKEAVGYAFGFKLTSGFIKICYWPKAKVLAHAQKYSRAYRAGGMTPWKTEFDKMALKTVIANELSDWGILSVEWQKARSSDQGIVRELDAQVEFVDNGAEPAEISRPEPTGHQQATQGQQPAKSAEPKTVAKEEDNVPMDGATPLAKTEAPAAPTTNPEPAKAAETPAEGQTGQAAPVATQADGKSEVPAPAETAPVSNEPPDPALGPETGDTDAVASVKLLAQKAGVNWFQLKTFCLARHLMRPEQKKLSELAETKLVGMGRNFSKWLPDILKLPRSKE